MEPRMKRDKIERRKTDEQMQTQVKIDVIWSRLKTGYSSSRFWTGWWIPEPVTNDIGLHVQSLIARSR